MQIIYKYVIRRKSANIYLARRAAMLWDEDEESVQYTTVHSFEEASFFQSFEEAQKLVVGYNTKGDNADIFNNYLYTADEAYRFQVRLVRLIQL